MRGSLAVSILVLLAISGGCASMCDSSYDCDFHAFGGMRDRIDRKNGRVGSVFDPAAALPGERPTGTLLPPMTSPADSDDSSAVSDEDDSEEESELKPLLDKLDELDDLPTIGDDTDSEGSGDDGVGADIFL